MESGKNKTNININVELHWFFSQDVIFQFEIETILNKTVPNNIANVNKDSDTPTRPKTRSLDSQQLPNLPRTRKSPFGYKGFPKSAPTA